MRTVALGLLLGMAAGSVTATDIERGQAVFEHWCAHCHDTNPAAPGRLKLEWTRGEAKSVLTERTDLSPELVRAIVRRGQAEMPSFRKTEISDADLESVVGYLNRPR